MALSYNTFLSCVGMMEVKDEKPQSREEAPTTTLEAVLRAAAAAKQNGQQLHAAQGTDGQQIVLLQQSQLPNYQNAQPTDIAHGKLLYYTV